MVDYLSNALKRYSEMGFTPSDIAIIINKLLKRIQNPAFPMFMHEVDVIFAIRVLKIKPDKGRKRSRIAGKQRKMQGKVKNARE